MRPFTSSNRYVCTVLEEMRKCVEHGNYELLESLINEALEHSIKMTEGILNYEK